MMQRCNHLADGLGGAPADHSTNAAHGAAPLFRCLGAQHSAHVEAATTADVVAMVKVVTKPASDRVRTPSFRHRCEKDVGVLICYRVKTGAAWGHVAVHRDER